MTRAVSVLTVLTLLVVPLGLARPSTAAAASTMTIVTKERGGGNPVPHACYSVQDVGRGGSIASGCDDDGDGTITLTSTDPCTNCRVHQRLPDDPGTGEVTTHLVEPSQDGGFSQTYTFTNFLKPYLVVTALNARTGVQVPGACIAVADVDRGGAVFGGCDGQPSDLDGQRDGKIETPRFPHAGNYRVDQKSPPPPGYVLGAPVGVVADPATTGEFEAVSVKMPPAPRITIKTVDAKTGKRLLGACYGIADRSHGGGLPVACDGVKQANGFGDQDGARNGIVTTGPLPVGHTYLLDQKTVPRGYRLAGPDKTVTTVAGQNAAVTFKNRRTR